MTGELATRKRLVVDANILLRAVLGVRVRQLLEEHESSTDFFAPDVCFRDARRLVNELAEERAFDPVPALILLDQVHKLSSWLSLLFISKMKQRRD